MYRSGICERVLCVVRVMVLAYSMFFVLFFFEHKSAYGMRISDWSSDVCSSDLFSGLSSTRGLAGAGRGGRTPSGISVIPLLDRKSVVEGKSVSVRVDLGGGRITKKKNIKTSKRCTIPST